MRLWLIVLGATVVYCKLSQIIADHPPAGLLVALWWNVKVFAVWILVTLGATTRRGRAIAARIWNEPLLRIGAFLLLPTVALIYEWAVGGEPPGQLLYRRLPLYATALVAIGYFGHRLREPTKRSKPDDALTVSTSRGPMTIAISAIEVVVAAENYVEIHLGNGTQYLHRATLTSMAESLEPAGFVRIHRSMLVNIRHVTERLSQRRLRLDSGRIVRVGRAFPLPEIARIPP